MKVSMRIMKPERGFTLLELMIAIVVLAIIVAIGYPSYAGQVHKARRTDGSASLSRATMVMESCRSDLATYTGCEARIAAESEEGYYTLAVNIAPTGTSYTLTATATGKQANDSRCTSLTLSSQGIKGYTGSATNAAVCWNS